jgi:hypothetical protein
MARIIVMTPLEFKNEYLHFTVPTYSGATVNIGMSGLRYQNAKKGHIALYDRALIDMLERLLGRLTLAEKATVFPSFSGAPKVTVNLIQDVYTGIGTPKEIIRALQFVAYLYDQRGRFEKAEGLMARYFLGGDPWGDKRMDLWRHCKSYIGLNCNGFVGNYARRIGVAGRSPSIGALDYAPANKRRTSLGAIRANDVLVWTNGNHIAIIDRLNPGGSFTVAESTADVDGFCVSEYRVEDLQGDKFTVLPERGTKREVYIAPLNPLGP